MSSLPPTSSPAEGPVPSPRLPLHLHPASLARPILVPADRPALSPGPWVVSSVLSLSPLFNDPFPRDGHLMQSNPCLSCPLLQV